MTFVFHCVMYTCQLFVLFCRFCCVFLLFWTEVRSRLHSTSGCTWQIFGLAPTPSLFIFQIVRFHWRHKLKPILQLVHFTSNLLQNLSLKRSLDVYREFSLKNLPYKTTCLSLNMLNMLMLQPLLFNLWMQTVKL